MIWATFIAQSLSWLRTNWQGAIVGGVVVWACSALGDGFGGRQEALAVAKAAAAQNLSGAATASSGATIDVPGRKAMPCPEDKVCPECPPVRIVYDCKAAVAGGASSTLSATAEVRPAPGIPLGFSVGLVYGSDSLLDARVGLDLGRFSVDASGNSALAWRIGLSRHFGGAGF